MEQLSTAIFVRMNNEQFQATFGLQVTSNDQRLTFSLAGGRTFLLIWSVSNRFDRRALKSDSFRHRFRVIPWCISVIQSTCNFRRQNSKQHARAALAKQAGHRQLAYHSCINVNWFFWCRRTAFIVKRLFTFTWWPTPKIIDSITDWGLRSWEMGALHATDPTGLTAGPVGNSCLL